MGREHWVEIKLGDVCTIKTGKRDVNEGNPNGKYLFFTCAIEPTKIDFYEFSGEAILIAGNGFFNVKMYNGDFNAYQRTYVLQNLKINSKFVFNYLIFSLDKLTKDQRGTTVKYIRLGDVQNHSLPLPPLNEQKRIVEKLDAILPKVKSAKARLEKIPAILKKFRQSVLAAACSRRLTEDWRSDYAQRTGKELPKWEEKKVKEIALVNPKNKLDDNLEVSFIPMTLISSRLNENPKFEIRKWIDVKKGFTHFKNNDVVVAKITPCFENSKSCIMVNLLNGYGAGTTELFVLRCNDLILSKYLYYIIKSTDFIENGKNFMTGTAGQQRIPRWYIENYIIPLPPLEEQNEIVRRVEKLFALADSLEAKYKKAYERVEKLEQAILAKAFRGELVKPDPNDEPAEELLKRILEEKAKLEDGKKSKRRRTKNVK